MKYTHYLLVLAIAGLLFGACSNESNKNTKKNSEEMSMDHSEHAKMDMATGEPTGESIYNVNSSWKTRHGHTVKLDSLRGKIQVVAMVYTSCEYACPRILTDMKRIRDGLPDKALRQTNFLIVSIDPERDTPGKLKQFAKGNDLDNNHWTLLHGQDGDILELAALLGFKYKRISETDFTHSTLITLLNQEGEIIYQRKKLSDKPNKVVENIKQAVAE